MATMTIDHIGAFLLPDIFILRVIGRVAFLLFAWLIANGAIHTRNINNYLKRLFLLALISQVPFMLLFRQLVPGSWELNILFTLSLGLLAIIVIKKEVNVFLKAIIIALIALVAEILCGGFSYGAYGVFTIIIFYIFNKNHKLAFLLQAISVFLFFIFPAILREPSVLHLIESPHMSFIQPLGLLAFVLIYFYKNKKEQIKYKKIFYAFYPAHLFLIYLATVFIK